MGNKMVGRKRTGTRTRSCGRSSAAHARAKGRAPSQSPADRALRDLKPAADRIDARIAELRASGVGAWRGDVLARVRSVILQAAPGVVEEWKWDVPVWSIARPPGKSGAAGKPAIICTGETYKSVVKLTFASGAALRDPAGLFNSSLEGRTRRALDIRESDRINEKALRALVREAAALAAPAATKERKTPTSKRAAAAGGDAHAKAGPVRLLSGGNPQIAKGEGAGPVRAYIAAMPGWKREMGTRLDALMERGVKTPPGVRRAVKWNSPFYGVEGEPFRGWFASFHCFEKYIKVAFFRGAMLHPPPPGRSKNDDVRYLDIREEDVAGFDEARFTAWARQASAMEGWNGK